MQQVGKPSLPTGAILTLAALFVYAELPPIGTCALAWLGGIRILNSVAPRLPFSRAIHWLHAMTFELPAFLGFGLLRFIPMSSRARGNGRPILLVHGYMNHGKVWLFTKRRLEKNGFGPIYTISLGYPFRSIRHYAEKVNEKAKVIANQTGREDLVLIGHSMGGLVSAWYATLIALRGTVTDVITIGSPLNGTPLAHLGLGPNAREMEPHSEFIETLSDALASNRDIRFHHIATKSDQIVVPGTSGVIAQNNHLIVEDLGHTSLLYSKRVADQIASWLNRS